MANESKTAPYPKAGQVWQEVDPRFERFIRVVQTGNHVATIETVNIFRPAFQNHYYQRKPKTRLNQAIFERFNGKRGGYKYVEG